LSLHEGQLQPPLGPGGLQAENGPRFFPRDGRCSRLNTGCIRVWQRTIPGRTLRPAYRGSLVTQYQSMKPPRPLLSVFIATVVLCLGPSAAAQSTAFRLPAGGAIQCRVIADSSASQTGGFRVRVEFDLVDSRMGDDRLLTIWYDTSGAPDGMTAIVTYGSNLHSPPVEGFAIRFASNGAAYGYHSQPGTIKAQPDSGNISQAQLVPLAASEAQDARSLAAWLWTRRCRREKAQRRTP
jgi:hypothetical protein